jgi:hypothetical protein
MSINTRYPGQIVIADDPANIVFGTAMLGTEYGSVESASVTRDADRTEIEKAGGNLLALVLSKARFDLKFDVLFTDDVEAPGLAETIEFPLAGITGRILPPIEIKWEKKGQRMLSITATSWDSFSGSGEGDIAEI